MKVLLNFIPNPTHQNEHIEEKIDNYLKSLYITLKKDYKTKTLRNAAIKAIAEHKTYAFRVKRHEVIIDYKDGSETESESKSISSSDSDKPVVLISDSDESSSESESDKSVPLISDESSSDSEPDKSVPLISDESSSDSEPDKSAPLISDESSSESDHEENEKDDSIMDPVTLKSDEAPVYSKESTSDSEEENLIPINSEDSSSENESKNFNSLSDEEHKLILRLKEIENEKQKLQKKNGFLSGGNMYNSDYESEISDLSSKNYHKTYLIDSDSDEETFVDNKKNMTNKNYLNNLTIRELKNIMRENNIKVTNNGSYLKKRIMIKNIIKNFK